MQDESQQLFNEDTLAHSGHTGLEDSLHLTQSDLRRISLLLDDSQTTQSLTRGIPVKIFKNNQAVCMPRITVRVIDQDLFQLHVHPIQETTEKLNHLMQGHDSIHGHVEKIIDQKLLPHAAQSRGRPIDSTKPYSKKCTPLQYITHSKLGVKDTQYKFNGHIHQHFIEFLKENFFSHKYIERVLALKRQTTPQVCVALHLLHILFTCCESCIHSMQVLWPAVIIEPAVIAQFLQLQGVRGVRTSVIVFDPSNQEVCNAV